MSDILTKRQISHDEAHECLQRFVHSHFRDGREVARIGIPARPDYDDDLVLSAYIEQQRAKEVTPSCGCVFCDLKIPLHDDGFHHGAKGRRVNCSRASR